MGDAGAVALLDIPHLVSLNLSSNIIQAVSVQQMAEALAAHLSLRYIYLSNNYFDDEKAKVLARVLHGRQSIISIDLRSNTLTNETATALEKLTRLKTLGSGGDAPGEQSFNQLTAIDPCQLDQYRKEIGIPSIYNLQQLCFFKAKQAGLDLAPSHYDSKRYRNKHGSRG